MSNRPADSGSADGTPPAGDVSIRQRREALRRIGRAGAAAGAASPLSALANGTGGQKWCHDRYRTKKVHASISGCKSVVMSAQPGHECYGKPCSWYKSKVNIPSSCRDNSGNAKKFKDIFACVAGTKDSRGITYDPYNNNGCLFHKRIDGLCKNYPNSPEAHWCTAYCNSAALWNSSWDLTKFPYSRTEVNAHWTDPAKRVDAYTFYIDHMEGG